MQHTLINRKVDIILGLSTIFWAVAFNQGLITAYTVWITSDIFNHCLFVLPISLYLIWQKRTELQLQTIQPQFVWLTLLIPCILVYIYGYAGDIALLMHMATFAALPLIVVSIMGLKASKVILFPLAFMLFAIPVGEELIPTLQQVAASIAIFLLKLIDIPTYINGLYIEIPQGRFLVAEACSGISFFIVSIVFGCLFAYVSFYSLKRQLAFVLVSFIVPILANGVRVFGIIYIAHLTDMQYAAGADHLIYGWFFYCLVLFMLIILGNWMRDLSPTTNKQKQATFKKTEAKLSINSQKTNYHFAFVCGLLITQWLWLSLIDSPKPIEVKQLNLVTANDPKEFAVSPKIADADKIQFTQTNRFGHSVEIFIAYYAANSDGELVSGVHRRYDPTSWSLKTSRTIPLNNGNAYTARLSEITSPHGNNRLLLDIYVTNQYTGNSAVKSKLLQTLDKFLGADKQSHRLLVSAEYTELKDKKQAQQALIQSAMSFVKQLQHVYQ
ncbi:transmembrane protein EpsH [Catenovulum agarivorans DS-2]|uniref:Transmembrane protein EpsH n=1 Tax=Catenovulum agarivorans DS-2 TaxID=1328313 RepID=W7QH08_9ALTE|nr:EpsI domain-containing exosortase [Catenovulum agarivorans]EWH11156.1 transmembrane protein EpsH [Catenovulum agarivorans DS-2]